jgi:hypothetical protein
VRPVGYPMTAGGKLIRVDAVDARGHFGSSTRRAVPAHGWELATRGTGVEATRSGVPLALPHRRLELLA